MQCPACSTELPAGSRFCAACGKPIPGAAGSVAPAPSSDKWIVAIVVGVVGLIAVVGIGGIVAAIAIPNLLNAIDRGKQKRTMADLRTIATAMEAYAGEHDSYPEAASLEELRAQLEPDHARNLPVRDGWGHGIRVLSSPQRYELVSAGKDGVFQGCEEGATSTFESDICFADGRFVQWPGGFQR